MTEHEAPAGGTRRRPHLLLAAALLVVVSLVVTASVLWAPGSPTSDLRSAAAAADDVTPAQYDAAEPDVRKILERRAKAVAEGDLAAFRADLDRRDEEFVEAQELLLANLSKLDLSTWSYELSTAKYGLPDLAARYGGPSFIRVVVLSYALAGFDDEPAVLPQAFTFVQRQGRWLIAADADLDTRLQAGYFTEPWEGGSIAVARSRRALVVTDADASVDTGAVLTTVNDALRTIAASWPRPWDRRAVVVAVRDESGLTSVFKPGLVPEDFAAVALSLPNAVPQLEATPREYAIAGKRVVVRPEFIGSAADPWLMTHELTHLATGDVGHTAPTWLVEGFAEHVATRQMPARALVAGTDLRQLLEQGPVGLPAEGTFHEAREATNYAVSALACRYLEQTYGRERLARLYATWDRVAGPRYDAEVRQNRALRRVLGVGTADLERGLDAYLRTL